MSYALALLLLLPLGLHAEFQPLPADTADGVNKNFNDINQEIARLDTAISSAAINGSVFSSSSTFNSPTSFNSPVIVNSSITFNGGIFGQVANSTCTVVPYTSLGSSALSVGVATVTFTPDTGRLLAWYTGGAYHSSASVNNGLSLLVNGAYPAGLSDTVAVKSCTNVNVSGAPFDCSIPGYPLTVTAGTSNRFTLTAATKAGTLTIPPNGGNASFNTQAYFCVGEYK